MKEENARNVARNFVNTDHATMSTAKSVKTMFAGVTMIGVRRRILWKDYVQIVYKSFVGDAANVVHQHVKRKSASASTRGEIVPFSAE